MAWEEPIASVHNDLGFIAFGGKNPVPLGSFHRGRKLISVTLYYPTATVIILQL
jgi:hypothetical protein